MNYPTELREFIDALPPSTINNSRAYWRKVYEKALKEKYGGYFTNLLTNVVGLVSDRTPYDAGMEPEPHNFNN